MIALSHEEWVEFSGCHRKNRNAAPEPKRVFNLDQTRWRCGSPPTFTAPALTQPWTLLLDPAAAQSMIERVAKLKLPRRIYRPLEPRHQPIMNAELARFDAAVEAEAANDE